MKTRFLMFCLKPSADGEEVLLQLCLLKVLWLSLAGLQLLKASRLNTYLFSNCSKLQDQPEFKELLIALLISILPGCAGVLFSFTNKKCYPSLIRWLL